MKIGILTFHCADNYGAVIQAFCLQEYLREVGHDAYVIDYRPKYITYAYRIFGEYSGNIIKHLLRSCIVAPSRLRKHFLFQRFRDNHLQLVNLDLERKTHDFDAFVFGSDQIWSPAITRCDEIYFGQFNAAIGKKLIAYSASMGTIYDMGERLSFMYENCLKDFSAISVRENTLASYLCEHYQYDVTVTCDPVILAGKQVLDKLAVKPRERSPYVLLILMAGDEKFIDYAQIVADRLLCKLVILATYESVMQPQHKKIVSPESYLGYIKYASYIITTSFHGTALSILFHKEFATLKRSPKLDERAFSLLKKLGLEDRMIEVGQFCDNINIDYSQVDIKLKNIVLKSKKFLANNLGDIPLKQTQII